MKVISIANQKGGVAKTTTARETASMLADAGAKVLMLDLDGQRDLTSFFLEGEPELSISDVLEGADVREAVTETDRKGLFLIGASDREHTLDAIVGYEREAIRRVLKPLEGIFDYCVVDFPRAASHAALAALTASDFLVIPTEAERSSIENACKLLDLVSYVQEELNPSLKVAGILITKYQPRVNIAKEYEAALEESASEYGATVFKSKIPLAAAVAESTGYGLTLAEHKPGSKPALAYKDYLIELLSCTNK